MSGRIRKPTFCICENKGADQLRSNCEADQRLCFRYIDSTIPLLLKSEISIFYVTFCDCTARFVLDLVRTEVVGFLMHRITMYLIGTCNVNTTFGHPPKTGLHDDKSSVTLNKMNENSFYFCHTDSVSVCLGIQTHPIRTCLSWIVALDLVRCSVLEINEVNM